MYYQLQDVTYANYKNMPDNARVTHDYLLEAGLTDEFLTGEFNLDNSHWRSLILYAGLIFSVMNSVRLPQDQTLGYHPLKVSEIDLLYHMLWQRGIDEADLNDYLEPEELNYLKYISAQDFHNFHLNDDELKDEKYSIRVVPLSSPEIFEFIKESELLVRLAEPSGLTPFSERGLTSAVYRWSWANSLMLDMGVELEDPDFCVILPSQTTGDQTSYIGDHIFRIGKMSSLRMCFNFLRATNRILRLPNCLVLFGSPQIYRTHIFTLEHFIDLMKAASTPREFVRWDESLANDKDYFVTSLWLYNKLYLKDHTILRATGFSVLDAAQQRSIRDLRDQLTNNTGEIKEVVNGYSW